MRRSASRRIRPRHLAAAAAAALVVLLAGGFYAAYTASATVDPSAVGYSSSAVGPNDLKPSECTMTVTSVLAGSGTISATAQFQLVLGSSAKDTVSLQKNDCYVGGGPTSGQRDAITGANGSSNGDQCIVPVGVNPTRCTVVANRP